MTKCGQRPQKKKILNLLIYILIKSVYPIGDGGLMCMRLWLFYRNNNYLCDKEMWIDIKWRITGMIDRNKGFLKFIINIYLNSSAINHDLRAIKQISLSIIRTIICCCFFLIKYNCLLFVLFVIDLRYIGSKFQM